MQDVSRATRKGKAINGNLLKIKQCKSFTRFVFSLSAVVKNQYSPFAPPQPPLSQILHNLCFSFLLGITAVPREIENNAYAKFWGTDSVHLNAEEIARTNHNESFTRNHVSESYTRSQDSDTLARSSDIHKYSKPIFIYI